MIEILQGYDRAPIVTLETDDASALESKLSAAARLFTDRKSWQKPFERIAILHRLSVLLEGKREHFGLQIALISQKMKSGDNLTLTQSNAAALEEHWRGNRESPPLPIIAWTRRATGPKHCFWLSYH